MIRRKDPAVLLKIQQAFEEGGDRRPPLHQWMASNYDALVEMFAGARVNWAHLTASFAEIGFRNGDGGDLRPETVRRTWYRVRKHKATRARKATRQSPAPVGVLSTPAPVPRSLPTPSPTPAPPTSVNDAMADVLAEMNKRSGRI
jgi:hypothetical protein